MTVINLQDALAKLNPEHKMQTFERYMSLSGWFAIGVVIVLLPIFCSFSTEGPLDSLQKWMGGILLGIGFAIMVVSGTKGFSGFEAAIKERQSVERELRMVREWIQEHENR